MTVTQVTLTEAENQALKALSQMQGKTQEEILHQAIEQLLAQPPIGTRLALLRQARGLWQERQDLPDFGALREEWDRA